MIKKLDFFVVLALETLIKFLALNKFLNFKLAKISVILFIIFLIF